MLIRRKMPRMHYPPPWHRIAHHDMLVETTHDERARLDCIAHLNVFAAQRLAPTVKAAFECKGVAPIDRHEVRQIMERDPAFRAWSLVRRNTMEMRQKTGRDIVGRQREALRDKADRLNASHDSKKSRLYLDPALAVPRYVAAVDQHLMQGGYTAQWLERDVSNAANYDAGMFATVAGSAGPHNDAAGRALSDWLRREFPAFVPERIVDLGCGLGHNTLPLRRLFPAAKIIAIDVAAPMLRYGHARARALGVDDIEFRQEDATRTSLAAHSADLVFSTMVLHETSHDALPKLLQESHRLLRGGGLAIHLEQPPYRGLNPFEQFMRDWDGRYNNEPFWSALHESDLRQMMTKAGFGEEHVFETRCVAPTGQSSKPAEEDFGRAPAWYAVGAWQAVEGYALPPPAKS